MLEHKGVEHEVVELPTGLHPIALRLRGFAGNPAPARRVDGRRGPMLAMADRMGTVPSLRCDGQEIRTNREIARFLERLRPNPPLLPSDPEARRAVEEAERWGSEVFQMTARRLALAASLRGLDGFANRGDDGRLGPLLWRQRTLRLMGTRLIAVSTFGANGRAERELLDALPGQLDRIDAWIEAGVLNGDELNAADFMIAPSLALCCYRHDLAAEIGRRPAIGLVDRLLPEPVS